MGGDILNSLHLLRKEARVVTKNPPPLLRRGQGVVVPIVRSNPLESPLLERFLPGEEL